MQSTVWRRADSCNPLALPALLALLVFSPISAFAQPTQPQPELLGFSSERLGRLHEAMQGPVDEKSLAGVVTLLMRHGKLVEERSYGVRDMASGAP
jgi:CubicO group peptidase (beta-lactamase class C family)